ncbi:MAG: hypothetical protein NVSMB31_09000 [Vulcanimicrobiaceae bacterium]
MVPPEKCYLAKRSTLVNRSFGRALARFLFAFIACFGQALGYLPDVMTFSKMPWMATSFERLRKADE